MITFLYILYVMVCLFLILVVLLQAGKGGMGAAFGGSSATVFGSAGAGNFLTRLTVISAALFMMLSATLTYVSSSGEKSLERASERIRMREEAASGKSKDEKKPASAKTAAPAAPGAQSSPESAPAAPAAPAEAPASTSETPSAPAEPADKDEPKAP